MIKAVIFDCFGVLMGEVYGKLRRDFPKLDGAIMEIADAEDLGRMTYAERVEKTEMSYEVGLLKPDLRIFKLAAERLGVEPDECVFIDDSETNVAAAQDCGMKGIVYKWGMDLGSKIS